MILRSYHRSSSWRSIDIAAGFEKYLQLGIFKKQEFRVTYKFSVKSN